MSDAGLDPVLSDEVVGDQATPTENGEQEMPRDTIEDDGLDEEVDDLFGDDGDAPG